MLKQEVSNYKWHMKIFLTVIVVPNPWDGCAVGKKSMCKICNPICTKLWIELIGQAIGRGLQQIDLIQSVWGFVKMESTRKSSNFNFQWIKTLYQNNLKHIAFFFTFFQG